LLVTIVSAIVLAKLAVAPDLAAAMMQDKVVSACAQQSGKSSQDYIRDAFEFQSVRLRGGEQMTAATATDPCLALGQSTRVMIYEKTPRGYRRVLDDVTLPGLAKVSADGSVVLPTHESMEVIFEATYLWNGTKYVFAPLRSHRYNVVLGQRRAYDTLVRPVRGAPALILSGTVAYNFGDDYVFDAVAGETITVQLVDGRGRQPHVALYYKDDISSLAALDAPGKMSKRALRSGTYHLMVWGADDADEARLSRYEIRVSLR
jgi:hypothetical protein